MQENEKFIARLPKAPAYLSPTAKKEYKRLGEELVNTRRLTTIDMKIFENACHQYGIWQDLLSRLQSDGRSIADLIIEREGNSQKLGEINLMNKANTEYTKAVVMFMKRKPGELIALDDIHDLEGDLL